MALRGVSLFPIVLLAAAVLGAAGCGPGMPFMTAGQQALVNNVDTLVKENEALKKRVAALESAGAGDHTRTQKDIAGLRAALADSSNSIEQVRQEFSFVKGSFEETSHARAQTREDLKNLNASIKGISARLAAADSGLKELGARLDAVDKKTSALFDAAVITDKKLTELETKAAKERETAASVKKGAEPPEGAQPLQGEDPQALYRKGKNLAARKDYQGAIDSFGRFLAAFPKHKLSGSAQYWLGETYYLKGDYEKAIVELDKVAAHYPDNNKIPSAVLKQGLSFEKLGSKKDATALYKKVAEKYPKSPEAAAAKKRLKAMKGR
ncbi:MAG: tol-pal system protein YbgF [Deltaproteobacteria bacterium]|nr:tol-pal system protein YbgF [Deltaproteobacteria bacterium]